jgi:hypothetical protein
LADAIRGTDCSPPESDVYVQEYDSPFVFKLRKHSMVPDLVDMRLVSFDAYNG